MNENWTLKPVVDSNRLALMQCAYRKATGAVPPYCETCYTLELGWFGEKCNSPNPSDINSGWICSSKRWKDVPKSCCDKYGYHCGTYVWVNPGDRQEFSKLVLQILNYATGTKATPTSKVKSKRTMTFYLNTDGSFGSNVKHATSVVAEADSEKTLEEIDQELKILCKSRELAEKQKLLSLLEQSSSESLERRLLSQSESLQAQAAGLLETNGNNVEKAKSLLLNDLRELQNEIKSFSADNSTSSRSLAPEINFGRPTQDNGINILQLKQQLDLIGP
jgi:hypothetical protein